MTTTKIWDNRRPMTRFDAYAILFATSFFGCSNLAPGDEGIARSQDALKDASASTRTDVVAVLARVNGNDAWCTGVVLEPTLVLTAQHCLAPAARPNTTFDCATATLTPISPQSQAWVAPGAAVNETSASFIAVSTVRVPAGASRSCGDDIALLELSAPLPGARLASLTTRLPLPNTTFTGVGYGTDGTLAGILRENDGATVTCTGVDCADSRIASAELLAASGACEGDSGGPAFAS